MISRSLTRRKYWPVQPTRFWFFANNGRNLEILKIWGANLVEIRNVAGFTITRKVFHVSALTTALPFFIRVSRSIKWKIKNRILLTFVANCNTYSMVIVDIKNSSIHYLPRWVLLSRSYNGSFSMGIAAKPVSHYSDNTAFTTVIKYVVTLDFRFRQQSWSTVSQFPQFQDFTFIYNSRWKWIECVLTRIHTFLTRGTGWRLHITCIIFTVHRHFCLYTEQG